MLVVNLFGAPGAGKSTGASYVFSQLKMMGVNAELVTEFAKDKVDVVITDSPILLSAFYANDLVLGDEFDKLVTKVFNSYNSINVFINRVKPYNPSGRFQNETESDELSSKLLRFVTEHGVACRHYNGDLNGYDTLINDILCLLKCNN